MKLEANESSQRFPGVPGFRNWNLHAWVTIGAYRLCLIQVGVGTYGDYIVWGDEPDYGSPAWPDAYLIAARLMSPSRKASAEAILPAIKLLKAWGHLAGVISNPIGDTEPIPEA